MAAASTAPARRASTAPREPRRAPRLAPRPEPGVCGTGGTVLRNARGPQGSGAPARRAALPPMPARLVPLAVGRTAVAVSGLADSGVVHRLTRGRLWIGR